MPPAGKTSTTRLPRELVEELGIKDLSRSKGKKRVLDRKERRKQEREVRKKQRIHYAKHGPPQLIPHKEPPPEKKSDESPQPRQLKSILKKTKPVKLKTEPQGPQPRPHIRQAVKDKLAEDDAEISYLEKKLRIKSKKLPSSFQEDGLDLLIEGLDEDFLGSEKVRVTKKRRTLGVEQEEQEEDRSGDMELEGIEDEETSDKDEDEDDGLNDLLGGGMDLGECGDMEDDVDEDQDQEEEFTGINSEVEIDPRNPVEESKFEVSTSKYIPPSLRKTLTTDSELLIRLQRQCKGLFNRLSEVHMISILTEVETIYRSNPRGHVTSTLSDILISIICDPSLLMDTFMVLHAGFVAGLYKLIGTDFGAHIVQRIVEDFDVHYQKTSGVKDPSTGTKECTNLVSFLAGLYSFRVVGPVLVFDLIRTFLGEITELNTELLLKIVRNSGIQLRQDDPAALKDLVLMMQPAIAKIGQSNLSIRTKFMIEALTSLKNNRLKSAAADSVVTAQATSRMKKLVGSLNNRQIRASEPLRASLDDIRNTKTKGKWWLVGASWTGNQAPTTEASAMGTSAKKQKNSRSVTEPGGFGTTTDLAQLAREQRMNTDIRRSIFITVMSAEDYTDAHNRLLKLRLKRKQAPEIPRVLVHCCGSETSYNPYYTLIARKLCEQRSLRMTFAFCLWDIFRRMGEDDGGRAAEVFDEDEEDEGVGMRKMVNLSRMYGSLIAEGALTLAVLKTLNMAYLQSKTKTFLELMFINIILHSQRNTTPENGKDGKAIMDIFLKAGENADLARNVLFFLRKYVKATDVAGGDEETATVRWGAGVACDGLKAIAAREIVGN